jgi:ABC-2 type transport system permease protein
MVAIEIVRRDLTRFVRNPVTTALMFAIPLSMAGIFTLIFGGSGGAEGITVRVLVHDEDDSLLSRFLQGGASDSSVDERLELVPVGEEGYQMMEEGEASALLHIPEGFTDDFLSASPTTLEVVKNPAQRFLPQLVEEGAVIGAVILSQASLVFGEELSTIRGFMQAEGVPEDVKVGTLSVAVNQKMRGLERFVLPPIVELETVTLSAEGEDDDEGFSILGFILPGMTIFGILFMAQAASRDILNERESGLLRHLLTAPVSVGDYLVGKCLSVFVVTGLGFAILVVVGLVAGVRWGSPPAVVLLMLVTTLAAAGTLILLMSLAGTQRQGDAMTTVVIIVFSLLGGAFVPLDGMPEFLLPLSRSTLTYWAVDGFNELIQRGGGVGDIAVNLAVLALVGVVFLAVGTMVLRRKILQGVL